MPCTEVEKTGPEIVLGRLDRRVSEQELNLLDISASLAAELGAGAAEIVGAEALDPICLADCFTTDHTARSPIPCLLCGSTARAALP